eukprot:scaffold31437_cov55-Phaeocystis_antarctica.AAC.1
MLLRLAGKSGRCSRANWWKGFVNARFGAGAGGAAGGGVGGVGKAVCVEDELAEESPNSAYYCVTTAAVGGFLRH